jgi:hypothetical protein
MRVEGGRDERRPSNHRRSPPPPPSFLPLRRRAIPPPAIPAAHSRASRDPKKKHKGQGKTYYHVKDINFLAHEPLLDKFRALRAYERKIKKAKARSHHAGPRTTAFNVTLVPVRPRRRGERRFLRTSLPGASLRPGSLGFNSRHTPLDAF